MMDKYKNQYGVITPKDMYDFDNKSIKLGITSLELMENAGRAVSDNIRKNYKKSHVLVICGNGNNAGDGFVVAKNLREANWPVKVMLINDTVFSKDTSSMLERWGKNDLIKYSIDEIYSAEIIVDAIFGSGLNRPLNSFNLEVVSSINASKAKVISIDLPSGVNGETGDILNSAVIADSTVTFIRKKIGHLLLPGKQFCGEVYVENIGTQKSIIENFKFNYFENNPNIWSKGIKLPNLYSHKYQRGFSVINSGKLGSTNAAKLAAESALRIGSGVVAICCVRECINSFTASKSSLIIKESNNIVQFIQTISDPRCTAVLIGPGNGINDHTYNCVIEARKLMKPCVIDADAISVFKNKPNVLFDIIDQDCILTPHEGEFERIFPNLKGNKIERVKEASKISGAIIVLKGSDTLISSPDGRVIINSCAPPTLATAGSGDVLAGIILGLLSQGTDPFLGTAAAVWIHSISARLFGFGLIADDLVDLIPKVLNTLFLNDENKKQVKNKL
ncbi:MAG: bifunctional ADP-dependent NAD(P)H-hydrate dehydratase/NAD(P)H-hydrate epimerase [Rhodospirillaceae bacterium]|nr:bifunctional ADP-dependent NAD(P)H-hydrate dehydratase/NAD(P)H-hydrate epimerase [Rhodospirillaceae bacterium]|tara:strand:- start:1196 stop:2710 length:1515 start_codon:yes stop_codon:yes gene_type:complete